MKKKWKRAMAVCMVGGLLAVQVAGCSKQSGSQEQAEGQKQTEGQGQISPGGEDGNPAGTAGTQNGDAAGDIRQSVQLGEGGEKEITWLAEDFDADWDGKTVTGIVCKDSGITVEGEGAVASGQTVAISQAGTYVVTGTMSDGQILIDTEKGEIVHLVLNGVELSNRTTAPIYSMGKGKVILTLEEGTANMVSDSSQYQYETDEEDEPDAPIFIKGDLTVNGEGTLNVIGNYQCGIRSKGELRVASGTVDIQAQSDGLKGRDCVVVRDGSLAIRSGKDGMKSNNDEDGDKGYIWVDGGLITIAAKDDGIQAETNVIINGGEIHITESDEGIAGLTVDILGGVTKLASSDDGINSAAAVETEEEKKADQDGVYIRIAGGEIHINAMADGIDSNGDFYMEGGLLYLNGPSGSGDGILDYNGTGTVTGGTMFGVGSAGMMQVFDETKSTQKFLVVYFTEPQKAGTTVALTDDSGAELGSIVTEKDYAAVIITTPDIKAGSTYHVAAGGETAEMQVEGIMTIYGTAPDRGLGGRERRGDVGNPGADGDGGRGRDGQGQGGQSQGERGAAGETPPARQTPPSGTAPSEKETS